MANSLALLSLLFSCFFASGLAVTCTQQHIGHTYTDCINGKRMAIYYWNQPCEVGSFTLPSSIYDLPCSIECNGGQYLPFGGTQCLPCDKGKYSLGGGEIISNWTWIPERMTTACTGFYCRSWVANGAYIESGNNTGHDNIESRLTLFARFVRPTGNLIRFTFTVDAESCTDCDGMTFYIDNEPKTSLLAHQLRWKTLEFEVTQGYHEFRWSYTKDYSVTRGLDKAFIRSIELIGTTSAPESCADCSPGTFGNTTGSTTCPLCSYNEYSALPGQESCSPCPSNQAAFPGSPQCTTLPACQTRHIFSKRTPCDPRTLTQNIEYHFITLGDGRVKVCDETHPASVSLNSTETNVPCFCPPGQVLLNSTGVCVHCPDGTARNSTQTTCDECPIGTAALESLYLGDWTSIPSRVQTFCQGDCDAQGWIPRGEHIDTGYGSSREFQSFLSISNLTIARRGAVTTVYSLSSCPTTSGNPTCLLELIIDNDQAEEVESQTLYTGSRALSFILDPGNYTLTWRYSQKNTVPTESTKVKLYRIVISGVDEGGAPTCVSCPAGSEATAPRSSFCTLCNPGTYAPQAGGVCRQPDPGYIARGASATRQILCGANTSPNPEKTDCITDCTFTFPDADNKTATFDLSPLYQENEPMIFAGTDTRSNKYFLNLCSRNHTNATCANQKLEPIPTFACQTVFDPRTGQETAFDLGNIIGFVPNPEGNLSSFTVTMTEGTSGCARTNNNVAIPRATNITMICDLSAGVGAPRPASDEVEAPPIPSCHYHFIWRSMHACRLCTPEDYKMTITGCLDGKKIKTYVRQAECYDPNPIPPENIPCKVCPAANNSLCNNHGSCDDVLGTCNCENNWAGDACELCSFGYFGQDCLEECPGGANLPCHGHGICNAGLAGNGTCTCSTGWAGKLCDTCDLGFAGDSCEAIPATITQVVPWWGFVVLFGGLAIIVVFVIILWRQKRKVEFKYSSLLKAQPLELDDDSNVVGIPQDDSDHEGK